jgi:hypothetical protein
MLHEKRTQTQKKRQTFASLFQENGRELSKEVRPILFLKINTTNRRQVWSLIHQN